MTPHKRHTTILLDFFFQANVLAKCEVTPRDEMGCGMEIFYPADGMGCGIEFFNPGIGRDGDRISRDAMGCGIEKSREMVPFGSLVPTFNAFLKF